ncbi:ABC transporter permease, partial [Bacillus sp. RHFS18]|nr:ABC transporter permease [Bacillus sp. RHFS18]
MNKFWIMLFHTYKNKIATKSFIISTAITVLLVLAVTNLQSIISVFQSDDGKQQIAVIDETGGLYPAFAKQLKAADTDNDLQAMETKESEKDAVKRVKDGEWDGLFIIRQDQKGTITG